VLQVLGDDAPPRLLTVRRAEALGRYANMGRLRERHGRENGTVCAGEGFELRLGDFREVLADIPDASVDVVIVDPPFNDRSLELWSDISALGARVLKPGRPLVAYAGILRLDDHMARLGEHLQYVWTGSTEFTRPTFVHPVGIWSRWRPWLVFSNGPYRQGEAFHDRLMAGGQERTVEDHPWRQAVGPFRSIVKAVTKPGDIVLDCCCGQGTTGVAALSEARRFIGVDIDAAALAMATERLTGMETTAPM
jgi:16S rRNA G966 N2-methylase RsmD